MNRTDLFMADLSHALLQNIEGHMAIFYNSILLNTQIKDCDFSNANFTGADLTNSTFKNVILDGASFIGAVNIPQEILCHLENGKFQCKEPVTTTIKKKDKTIFFSMPGIMGKAEELVTKEYKRILEEKGFDVIYYIRDNYPKYGQLNKIRESITKASGIIAFGFKQINIISGVLRPNTCEEEKLESSWLSTPWSDIEVGMAMMLGLPILLIHDIDITQGVFDNKLNECFIGKINLDLDTRLIERNPIFEYGIRIIQNQVELFNNIDLKSLYIKNINNVLKDCISQLEDSFRKKNLFIKIADRDINTSDYYNKAETLKIKEYVHCLKLYHSTKISRPPLFIYYIEANFNYPVENSNKAICIKINDKNDLQEFIYKNIVKLYRNSKICYHNIKTHKRENKPEMDLQSTYNIDALNEINQVPQLPSDYKEDVIPFLMKEFNTKNIFIERYNNVVIALKPLYNNCERSDIKENVLLKIFNNNKAICPIYIQLCFNNESPIKDMPTIVLRLDLYGKWKESKHQECLLIKEGKNGEFYKIDHLYKNNKLDL